LMTVQALLKVLQFISYVFSIGILVLVLLICFLINAESTNFSSIFLLQMTLRMWKLTFLFWINLILVSMKRYVLCSFFLFKITCGMFYGCYIWVTVISLYKWNKTCFLSRMQTKFWAILKILINYHVTVFVVASCIVKFINYTRRQMHFL
jgi:hypothetical protein